MARRRPDDWLPEVPEDVLGPGQGGDPDVPFDQTAPEEAGVPIPAEAPAEIPVDPAGGDAAPMPGLVPGVGAVGGAPASPGNVSSDMLSDADLAAMGGGEDMAAAFEDPNTAPADLRMMQERLALAARRRLAGGL